MEAKVSQSGTYRNSKKVDGCGVERKLRNVMFLGRGEKWIPNRDYDEKNL
jgi:hypothetical protein